MNNVQLQESMWTEERYDRGKKNKYMMQVRGKRKFYSKDLEATGPSPSNVTLQTIGKGRHMV